jgi:hypothetical protein
MKKTRLFLVASCLTIAIVGVAATKAKKVDNTVFFFSGTTCLSETFANTCTPGGPGCKDGTKQLYQDNHCTVELEN